MKSHDPSVITDKSGPAAVPTAQERAGRRAGPAMGRHGDLQADIAQTPRMLAQRRAIDAAFGVVWQRQVAEGANDKARLRECITPIVKTEPTTTDASKDAVQARFNDDGGLEREADAMGAQALRERDPTGLKSVESVGKGAEPMQRRVNHMNRSADFARQVVQRVDWATVEHNRIRVEMEGPDYVAYYNGTRAGTLELYEDSDGRQWINNIETSDGFQGRGIGLSLVRRAVNDNDAIHAAVGMTRHDEEGEDDTRHLSEEGAALVNSAIRNGILQSSWCYNPAEEQDDDGSPSTSGSTGDYEPNSPTLGGEHEGDQASQQDDDGSPSTSGSTGDYEPNSPTSDVEHEGDQASMSDDHGGSRSH